MHACMRPPAQRRSMQALHMRRRLAACTRTAAKKSAITVRSSTTCTAPQRCQDSRTVKHGFKHFTAARCKACHRRLQTLSLARQRSQVQSLPQKAMVHNNKHLAHEVASYCLRQVLPAGRRAQLGHLVLIKLPVALQRAHGQLREVYPLSRQDSCLRMPHKGAQLLSNRVLARRPVRTCWWSRVGRRSQGLSSVQCPGQASAAGLGMIASADWPASKSAPDECARSKGCCLLTRRCGAAPVTAQRRKDLTRSSDCEEYQARVGSAGLAFESHGQLPGSGADSLPPTVHSSHLQRVSGACANPLRNARTHAGLAQVARLLRLRHLLRPVRLSCRACM